MLFYAVLCCFMLFYAVLCYWVWGYTYIYKVVEIRGWLWVYGMGGSKDECGGHELIRFDKTWHHHPIQITP